MTGSLQIADLIEQPGAILVQWYDEVMTSLLWVWFVPYRTGNTSCHEICAALCKCSSALENWGCNGDQL